MEFDKRVDFQPRSLRKVYISEVVAPSLRAEPEATWQLISPMAAFGRNQMHTLIIIMNFLQKSEEVTDKESILSASESLLEESLEIMGLGYPFIQGGQVTVPRKSPYIISLSPQERQLLERRV